MVDMEQITKQTEKQKEYRCYQCGEQITFKYGEKDERGKAKRFNMNGTVHVCGQKQEGQQQKQQQENNKKTNGHRYGYNSAAWNSRNARYWRWYWSVGPGRHKRNEEKYSSDEYQARRNRAKEQYNNYKQNYRQAYTSTTVTEACQILGVGIDVIKMKFEEGYEIIRRAFRVLALKTHPDKGGTKEEFCKVNEAFELLKTEIAARNSKRV
jgi:DNA-directed RNA polymerase subunit RPC12/RpoP